MEFTDKEIHLLAQLSWDRGLYAECKGTALDALQELGLLQWFDARSSTTPFEEDPRPLLKLHGIGGRIDYAWIGPVENWRQLVGPEVTARVDAIDKIEWAENHGPQAALIGDNVWAKIVGRVRRAVLAVQNFDLGQRRVSNSLYARVPEQTSTGFDRG